MNCLEYYSFAFGRLKIGVRVNSSAAEVFTNIDHANLTGAWRGATVS